METQQILKELEYALLTNDVRLQNELLAMLELRGIDKESACISAFNIYIRGE